MDTVKNMMKLRVRCTVRRMQGITFRVTIKAKVKNTIKVIMIITGTS